LRVGLGEVPEGLWRFELLHNFEIREAFAGYEPFERLLELRAGQ